MKKFCEILKEYAMKIINFKNNETKLVTKEQHELSQKSVTFVKKHLK